MMKKYTILLIFIMIFTGCSSLLPTTQKITKSPWTTFEEIENTYCKIENYKTSKEELHALGFNPRSTANIRVLNHLNILEKFLVTSSIKIEDLDVGIQACLQDEQNCIAYEVEVDYVKRKRFGSVFLDLFNFRKNTHETGWSFRSLIVLNKDVVIYKMSQSVPQIDNKEHIKNPLGPFQSMESVLRSAF